MIGFRNNRGAALILVLWLVAALSLVVLASAQGIRQQTRNTAASLERLRSEAILDAAMQLTAQQLWAEKGVPSQYRLQRMVLGSNEVRVEITPASGLIDVAIASDALLQALFQRVGGVEPGAAAMLVSRVKDFIDPDDSPSGIGGAEAAQYRAASWPSMPRNSALEDLSELKSVLGMSAELYEIISPYLSVNGQQRLDINSTPPALIDALTGQQGLGAQIHSSAPEMRASVPLSGVVADFFSAVSGGNEKTVRVRAFVQAEEERWWLREAWIDLNERPDTLTPWTTLTLEPTRRVNKPEQEFNP